MAEYQAADTTALKHLKLAEESLGHRATIGIKVFNITNHFNPRDYQGNLASHNFGTFDNSVGRTLRGKWIFEF